MKLINFLAGGILLTGAAISLHNSANDYGLRTNNLAPNVAAQSDDTSGGSDDTNGYISPDKNPILEQHTLFIESKTHILKSDDAGIITFYGFKLPNYKPNTYYYVFIESSLCSPAILNLTCDLRKQSVKVINLNGGDETNGKGTN